MPTFLEFFAGGGLARLGLGAQFTCAFANDIDPMKGAAYASNFGNVHFDGRSVAELDLSDLPRGPSDLVWASFPCQDLSLAGGRNGLNAARSGTFFPFWSLVQGLIRDGRRPPLIVLENVAGLLSSSGGEDFRTILQLIAREGYLASAIIADARWFVPQSRPRLFIFAFDPRVTSPPLSSTPPRASADGATICPAKLARGVDGLDASTKEAFFWLDVQPPKPHGRRLADCLEGSNKWDNQTKTTDLLGQMAPHHVSQMETLMASGERHIGAAFRRMRTASGIRKCRIEPRFDGLAGCLRTPAGGSSRQILIEIEKEHVRTRLISPRESARLMGIPDDYLLPPSATHALKLVGDGVCVPLVEWLGSDILLPALTKKRRAA